MMTNPTLSEVERTLRATLADVLGMPAPRIAAFTAETELFGALPEFDSMAVAGVLTEIEERLGIFIDDDEVDGEIFETYGKLLSFAAAKVGV